MTKAVVFDFFGVLYGSYFKNIYSQLGGNIEKDYGYIRKYLKQANSGEMKPEKFAEIVSEKLGLSLNEYNEALKGVEGPNLELLDYIKNDLKPKYKLAIISNAGLGTLQSKVPKNLLDLFDEIIVSAELGIVKPDHRIYKITLKKLGIEPEEAIFTDDIERHVSAARDLGMKTVHFKDTTQFMKEFRKIINAG